MTVTVTWTGLDRYRTAVASFPARLLANVNAAVSDTTQDMRDNIFHAAYDGPRPRVRTGALSGSITGHTEAGPDGFIEGVVSTDVIYARRVEYGYYGIDSIGRFSVTPPYPFWGPGFERTRDPFYRRLSQALAASG